MDPVVNSKGEKDERFESNKEIKHDWGSQNESKGGDYGKGVREHHNSNSNRGGGGYVDNWRSTSLPPPGPIVVVEVGKDTEVHEVVVGGKENKIDYSEVHEAVGENKVEDKFKDKDRKPRKDAKHHRDAAGERDKERCDRNLQDGISSEDNNNREAEKEGTINDLSKPKLKENDPSSTATCKVVEKLEKLVVVEKEGEKDLVDGSIGMLERENLALDHQTQIDFDGGWKKNDAGDRRKERDVVDFVDGERPDKRTRYCDKDSDDGCADVEEKEKDILFNYGVQQRKRMLRPRGSPQLGNRDPRVKSENDGSQGKTEVSAVVYKVGECMQELIKLWKDYESSETDKNGESSQSGPTLEIRIPAEYVTATNRQVRGGQLWGTDIYTDDSDLVAVLMHTGYCRPTASPPPPAIQELGATIRVLPPQDCYVSTLRNNVRSRAWGAAIGCSYLVERCCIVKKGGGTIDLEPCLTHTSTVEPTLAPVAVERTMTTRAAASNALRQQRFVREVTIQYNLCNEPWIKYSISIVADKGLKKPLYTSARLKKGEVLYLETHSQRYELCFTGEKMIRSAASSQVHEAEIEKSQNHQLQHANGERSSTDSDNVIIDAFRWSRSKKLLPQKLMRSVGIPLPIEYVEVLEENLDWEDIQWSQTGVCIARKEYALARVHFLSLN